MGVHKQTISGWENGRSWPEYDKLLDLSKHLGINPENLFETIGKIPAKPTPAEALEVLRQAITQKQPDILPEAEGFDEREMAMLRAAADAIREQRSIGHGSKKRENHS